MELKFKSIAEMIADTPNSLINHKVTENDLVMMAQWVTILSKFLKLKGLEGAEFGILEKRLGINISAEIRLLHENIGNSIGELTKESLKHQKFQLLAIENFWVEKDVIVKDYYTDEPWFKTDILVYAAANNIKKPIYGIDLKTDGVYPLEKVGFGKKMICHCS